MRVIVGPAWQTLLPYLQVIRGPSTTRQSELLPKHYGNSGQLPIGPKLLQ
jgi:hypothetical protein